MKLLSRGCNKIQIIDKEIADAVQVISAEEICIIRQLIEYYPKITEKQLREIKEFSKQDNQQKRRFLLLDSEAGHFDYGIEEQLNKETSNEQMAVDMESTKVSLPKAPMELDSYRSYVENEEEVQSPKRVEATHLRVLELLELSTPHRKGNDTANLNSMEIDRIKCQMKLIWK